MKAVGNRERGSFGKIQGAAMKKGWQTKPFEDCIESVKYTRKIQRKDFLDDGQFPIISQEAEFTNGYWDDEADVFKVSTPIVIFGDHTQVLKYVDFDFVLGADGVKILPPREFLYPKFFFYQLQAVNFTSLGYARHYRLLKELEIKYPPLAEQQRIVGLLEEAFEGIATAKANAEKNLQNARTLFESHLQSVFIQRGLGWKMEKLDDLTELARGHNPPKSKFSRVQKPGYVRFYQIRDGGTDDYAVYVPDTPQLHKMKKDDIMMVAYRHVGRAFRGVEGAFNVALCKISNARRDLLDDDYLFHMIPSPFVKGELLKRSERSLIPSMSIEHLRDLRIPLPPLSEQQKIVKLINTLSEETQRLVSVYQRKLAALEALKKSLLHQAFSGEL